MNTNEQNEQKTKENEIYTVFLGTNQQDVNGIMTYVDKTNLCNVTWYAVNWDSLFKGMQKKYSKCRLRYDFRTSAIDENVPSPPQTYNDFVGYISCSLTSQNNANTTYGTPIGLFYAETIPTFDIDRYVILSSTLDSVGVDIIPPEGITPLNISLYNMSINKIIADSNSFSSWCILLEFELYND